MGHKQKSGCMDYFPDQNPKWKRRVGYKYTLSCFNWYSLPGGVYSYNGVGKGWTLVQKTGESQNPLDDVGFS